MNTAAGKQAVSTATHQNHQNVQLVSRPISEVEDKLMQRQDTADHSQHSLQLHDKKRALSTSTTSPAPIQTKKGDLDDPHKAHESKPVYLPEVSEAVVVPGLAGCAAMRVNVFQEGLEGKRLVRSAVLHSEGKVGRSLDAAGQINTWITKSDTAGLSVEILVMYNGAHKPAESDHAPVLQALTLGLGDLEIPHSTRTEIVKSSDSFITIDLTGTEEEIMDRYHGQLKVPVSPALAKYRKDRFMANRNLYAKNGVTQDDLDDWTYRWGNTESYEQVDALILEASTSKKKKKSGLCYLTTACVEFAGLPDDCHELTMLRHFRDDYLGNRHNGAQLIAEYYAIAPKIVDDIDASSHRGQIYTNILATVRSCVQQIEEGHMEMALHHYQTMVRELQKRMQ